MALLNQNKNYIRLEYIDKNSVLCHIYTDKKSRTKEKKATSSEDIIKKYKELLSELFKTTYVELAKHGLQAFLIPDSNKTNQKNLDIKKCLEISEPYIKLREEYIKYNRAISKNITTYDFPIISKYFSDVKNSIPSKVCVMRLSVTECETIDDAYCELKNYKRFGKTTNC